MTRDELAQVIQSITGAFDKELNLIMHAIDEYGADIFVKGWMSGLDKGLNSGTEQLSGMVSFTKPPLFDWGTKHNTK